MLADTTHPADSARIDGVIAALLGLLAALLSLHGAGLFHPITYDWQSGDVLFSADVPRVYANMTDRQSNHYRTGVHPLFPLAAYPSVAALRLAGFDAVTAVRLFTAALAALWSALLFRLLRRIGCRRLDAAAFTGLGLASAAATFWFAVPETYGLGALTILLALLAADEGDRRRLPTRWLIGLNLVTLGVTLTNWMAGLLATWAQREWRRTLHVAAVAFGIALALSVAERALFSHVRWPFHVLREDVTVYTRSPSIADAGEVMMSFAVGSMVLPGFRFIDNIRQPQWPKMRLDSAGWTRPAAAFAAGAWIMLLAVGAAACARLRRCRSLRLVVAGTLLGQLALHLIYGSETFLYALHWIGPLVIVAAASTLTRARRVALLLCAALILVAGWNNATLLRDAAAYFGAGEAERGIIAAAGIANAY